MLYFLSLKATSFLSDFLIDQFVLNCLINVRCVVTMQLKNDMQNLVYARSHMTDDAFKDLVLRHLGSDLLNSIDVTTFDVANLLYGRIVEGVMISLESTLQSLVCIIFIVDRRTAATLL
jgi:hypothetical protein